ncbi:MAG TPA: hypothetical protein VLS90_11650 [Thermodesulfobacteriota bacterium]|nr:hypothetical protein [Thermodesulfobacteriota bacterium]
MRDIPEDSLTYSVLLKYGNMTGSGFFYNHGDAIYLVTARHVLFRGTPLDITGFRPESIPASIRHKIQIKPDPGNRKKTLLIFHGVMSEKERDDLFKTLARFATDPELLKKAVNSLYSRSQKLELNFPTVSLTAYSSKEERKEIEVDLAALYGKGEVTYHPSQDIAAIKMGLPAGISGLRKGSYKLFSDVLLGNTVYVFGYPTSITRLSPALNIRMPLLRKGIVAGRNNSLKTIILDCPMYYGNSGGMVLEIEDVGSEKKAFAVGVISQLVPFEQEWVGNSGYSIATPMDFLEELIGPKP